MNNIPKHGPDAPFLDEEEKDLVMDFEAAVEAGDISPQNAVEQEAIRDEWKGVLENTLKRKAITLRLQERDIKTCESNGSGDGYAISDLSRFRGASDCKREDYCEVDWREPSSLLMSGVERTNSCRPVSRRT